MTELLSVRDLRVTFPTEDGDVEAVRGVSFDIAPGETVGIVGESGSGKSVTSQAILRLLPDATVAGEVRFDGVDLLGLGPKAMRRVRGAQISMVFQDPLSSLHPQYRVGRQIVEAIRAHERISRAEAEQRAIALLEEVGLVDAGRRINDYPHQFSGGMRQRVMLAMALALRPKLLIADEPTTALDVTVQAQLLDLLARLQHDHGTAIVLVTHDLGVIAEVADRVLTMYAGRIVERASAIEVFTAAHHPYTRALLECVPSTVPGAAALVPIPGQPPSLVRLPPGCAFAPRCPHVEPQCRERMPPLQTIADGHVSECVLPADAGAAASAVPVAVAAAGHQAADTTGTALLRATDLVKHFPGRRHGLFARRPDVRAVDGVALEVYRGETLGLVGESGSGKSTLARLLAGLIAPTAGAVEIAGKDLGVLDRRQLRTLRRDVQVIFQDPYGSLNPRRRVGSIIADPLVIHGARSDDVDRRVAELMDLVGLNPEHHNRYPAAFSGGQRQRIGIARALALDPSLVICDEPVSALDVSVQAQIVNLLQRLQRELSLTYVVVSHDLGVIANIADRVAVMYLGRIVEIADTAQLYAAPRHPYTRALLDAVPVPDPTRVRARALVAGDVPSQLSQRRAARSTRAAGTPPTAAAPRCRCSRARPATRRTIARRASIRSPRRSWPHDDPDRGHPRRHP